MNERVAPHAQTSTGRKPVTDLRAWLDMLANSNRLAVARPGVKLRFELSAIAKTLDGTKATLFPRPDGHPVPVISGLTSDRGWMAEAMGVANDELLAAYQEAALNPLPWREVGSAPVHEVVHREVDLPRLLPIPVHNELDSGPYITAGLLISRNPKSGAQNVTIHRLQLSGPKRLGVLLLPRHTLRFFQMAEEAGGDLPVAIVIGVDPLTLLSSQAIAPIDFDELTIAGALHRRPLDVVKCLSSDIRVPANAEIVLEGRILARTREMEGPFGEFPQYYSEPAEQHVIEIDAVTHRQNPIFHTILGGGIEHLLLGGIPREATIMSHLRRSFPGVLDVHLSRGGTCRYHLNVKLDKRHEGEGKNVIMGAFGAHYDIKHVVVVDKDVDIHNQAEVEWAIATRFQADRDLVVVSQALGSRLDPSANNGVSAKMGFDATVPLSSPPLKYKRIRVPGEEAVDLGRMIDAQADWRKAIGS
ncbi:MAG TPA: UbiD family decarboxylase [Xanthobacteraceae bacterium]|nr:UbiD family decarboxylase [Xanthobacteraceae bacterium]